MERNETDEKQVVKPTSEGEQVTPPTSTELTSTSEVEVPKTYSQEEHDQDVLQGKAEVQSAFQLKLNALEKESREREQALRAEKEAVDLQAQEEKEREELGDTDELKGIQTLRRRVHETASQASHIQKHGHALLLGKQYGVDTETLLESLTFEEMETKAKELATKVKADATDAINKRVAQLEKELEEAKKPPQKIDSSAPGGAGIDWRVLSPEGKLREGLK